MVSTHRRALRKAGADSVTVLDTPYGFQENADELTERIGSYFTTSLGADVEVASLRSSDPGAAARERFLAAVVRADYLFSGPGSPTYALGIWRQVDLGKLLRNRLASGATVVMASAAALTVGLMTIPVYEIYKVGQDPYWVEGLDVTSELGLRMVVVPHWNNAEGGTHDTSHCYIGKRRFNAMARELEVGVLGIDEHTAAAIDVEAGVLEVSGAGEVTVLGDRQISIESGQSVPLEEVAEIVGRPPVVDTQAPPEPAAGNFDAALASGDSDGALAAVLEVEASAAAGEATARRELRRMLAELTRVARRGLRDPRQDLEPLVDMMLEWRSRARAEERWAESDAIRDGLAEVGIEVRDTAAGVEWELRTRA
jgi:cyanophycinase-like exopeptidase